MRFTRVLLILLLITPLGAGAATSTLELPHSPSTEGEAVLINWNPAAGTYRIVIELLDQNGAVTSSETADFTVDSVPPPPPEVQGTTTVESSEKIQETIASIVPQASAAAPVFSTIDNWRQKGIDALETGEAWAKGKVNAGEVAGENTEEGEGSSSGGIVETVTKLVATLLLYLFSILKFLVSNAGIFYPVLAIAFFYLLWRLFKRMRRPKYT
ncbi:MAG: hypothetical protein Q8P58_02865 [Candidatus Adlerbacteria bacterium]|nr:hypothetical protein [Candidatus Adlerbacteria bacterium]